MTWVIAVVCGSIEKARVLLHSFGELEKLVLAIWKDKPLPPDQGHFHLQEVLTEASRTEKQRLRDQLVLSHFPAAGGICVLDLLHESSIQTLSIQNETTTRTSLRHVVKPLILGSLANKMLESLKMSGFFEALPVRVSMFCSDTRGIISSSSQYILFLLKVKGNPEGEDLKKEKYVIAKLPNTTDALKSLENEQKNLAALQFTERVPRLWNGFQVGKTTELKETGLLMDYYPISLEWSSLLWLSLEEVVLLAKELLHAIQTVHAEGFAILDLNPTHILFTVMKADPRNRAEPLRITGLRKARSIPGISPDSKIFKEMRAGTASWLSPEIIDGTVVTEKADIYSAGLILLSCLQRELCSKVNNEADRFDFVRMSNRFNTNLYGQSQKLTSTHFLVALLRRMLSISPADRPSAAEAVSLFINSPQANAELILGDVKFFPVDGHLDQVSGRVVWPVVLKSTVIQDPRDKFRLVEDVSGFSSLHAPKRSTMAIYTGRPVSKRELFWMQHIGLATHAISDGHLWGLDGRRLCNGIFNTDYFLTKLQVTTQLVSQSRHACHDSTCYFIGHSCLEITIDN